MWQVALAAAVAGSGLLAKHLFTAAPPFDPSPAPENGEDCLHHLHAEETLMSSPPSPVTPLDRVVCPGQTCGVSNAFHGEGDQSFFRFSSPGSGESRSALKLKSKKSRVAVSGLRESKAKSVGGFAKRNADRGNSGSSTTRGWRKRNSSLRRVSLFFKRRKTSKTCTGKRDFNCSAAGPSFGWGLGIGIMYMMSTGKEEISKLNHTVDETAKVVHELKAELSKRRSRHRQSSSLCGNNEILRNESNDGWLQEMQQGGSESRLKNGPPDTKSYSSSGADDGEHASSILTEELLEGTDMDQLEADFETELQKLPSIVGQASHEGRITRYCDEIRPLHGPEYQSLNSFQSHGVSPDVLSEKLSDVLIKQQEGHISELESELKFAYSKLQEREAELQALKDCVKRLTEFSLSTNSDDEIDACKEHSLSME